MLWVWFWVFWWDWGLNSGLYSCKAGTLLLDPPLILLWLFWKWEALELFAQAGLKPQSSQSQAPK
jgi:hypothetical protein